MYNTMQGFLLHKLFLNNSWVFGRSGSNPKLPNNSKLLLVRITIRDKRYQRTRKNKEIMCDNE